MECNFFLEFFIISEWSFIVIEIDEININQSYQNFIYIVRQTNKTNKIQIFKQPQVYKIKIINSLRFKNI